MQSNISPSRKFWLVLLLGTVSATGPLSMDLYLPALPTMVHDLNTTTSLMQLSLSACLIGLALGQVIIGPLSDKYGRKRPLAIGFAAFGLISLAIAGTKSIYLLIFLRFLQGLAGASGQVLSRAIASDLFSGPLLTKFYSLLSAVNGIFPVISPIIGGFIIRYVNWQGIFLFLAIIGLIITLTIMLLTKETLPYSKRIAGGLNNTISSMFNLFKYAKFNYLIIAAGLVYGALFSYISASSFIFQKFFHMSVSNFSLLYALNGIGIAIGSVMPGLLANHLSIGKQTQLTLKIAAGLSLLLLISALSRHNLPLVIIPIFIIVILIGILLTLTTSIVMNLKTASRGGVSAILGLSQNFIGSLMSPLVGLMGTNSYLPMATALTTCFVLSWYLFNKDAHTTLK